MSKTIHIYKNNKNIISLFIDEDCIFNFRMFLDVEIISLYRDVVSSESLKELYVILNKNKNNINKIEYKENGNLILEENYINPKNNINISYNISENNQERLEILYINRNN